MKSGIVIFCLVTLLVACGGPEPRKPVQVKTGNFMKESVERNKKLLAEEEKLFDQLIAQDSLNAYHSSANGSRYRYVTKNNGASYFPQADDLVTLTYNVSSLADEPIYTEEEIGTVTYKVDKEELFPGLRTGIKLLKEGETAIFLFPSPMGYGYHGDNKKIGPNVPLKSKITVLKIEKSQDSIQN